MKTLLRTTEEWSPNLIQGSIYLSQPPEVDMYLQWKAVLPPLSGLH